MTKSPIGSMLMSVAAVSMLIPSGPLLAVTMDLSGLGNGQKIAGFEVSPAYSISSIQPSVGTHLGVAVFDTDPAGPNAGGNDPDLLVDRGNSLILQNSNSPDDNGGSDFFTSPNDDQDGGSIVFDFAKPITAKSVDLIDINGSGATLVTLTDTNGQNRFYDLPNDWTDEIPNTIGWATLDLFLEADQDGPGPGGVAVFSQDAAFAANDVIRIEFAFNSSGAINRLSYVPEPSSLALMILATLPLAVRRRR